MTDLIPFDFDGQAVRVVTIDGEPWFVLADLCKILGISAVGRVAARLYEGVRQTHTLPTAGGPQSMVVVSEPGMWEVVLRSDAPNARPVQRWVTGDVLPAIRRTGSYGTAPALAGKELLAHAVIEAHAMIEAKDQRIAELEPKADAWQDLVSSAGSLSFRDAAKVISEEGGVNISGPRLTEALMEWRWTFRPPATPEEKARGKVRSIRAYQTQIDAGTLTEKAKPYTDSVTGEKKLSNNPQTRVTGRGLDAIRARLLTTKEISA